MIDKLRNKLIFWAELCSGQWTRWAVKRSYDLCFWSCSAITVLLCRRENMLLFANLANHICRGMKTLNSYWTDSMNSFCGHNLWDTYYYCLTYRTFEIFLSATLKTISPTVHPYHYKKQWKELIGFSVMVLFLCCSYINRLLILQTHHVVQEMMKEDVVCEPAVMDSEDVLFLLYTSGSTGKPKGLVHTQAGYLLYAALTHRVKIKHHTAAAHSSSRES